MRVRILEVRCPKCGPRGVMRNDGEGKYPATPWQSLPAVVDVEELREEEQLCTCGEPVLIATEPVEVTL